ncbi:lysophospholipid acyltransferase family protein [Desertimonas flava]|uniref:lysophospholipid acyltransferase family protein n=1 Tax=Desertimonas flava TaxID=2064846 RepID=UPI0013C45954|nr:lysophospholipid acyltransferase family protein [Desertimonas flava]
MSRRPSRGGVLYGLLATVVSAVVALTARVSVERQRGRGRVARRLPDGPIIVVANHTSYADGVLLALACRRLGRSLRLLATAGVFKVPVLGRLLRRLGFIPVNRGSASATHALDAAAEALERGEAIGLFPEGRITRDPDKWPERAKTGAVRLAVRTGAPIVPVAMSGAHRLVGRKRILLGLLLNVVRRPEVISKVGEPIDVRALVGGTSTATPAQVREATDVVMRHVVDMLAALRDEHPT